MGSRFVGSRKDYLLSYLERFEAAKEQGDTALVVDVLAILYVRRFTWWVPMDEELIPGTIYDENALPPDVLATKRAKMSEIRMVHLVFPAHHCSLLTRPIARQQLLRVCLRAPQALRGHLPV